jgi:hypothetical protein
MSDLTGGKGRTTRTRQVVSNFGVLEKVQSNLSNKSGIKILDGSTTKFSFTALDFHRSVKMEKYKLDKLLGKESNKSAVFLTSKGCISGTNNFIIGQNPKEKQFNAQRCGRNGRGNSPQPQIELLRKGGYGSYTSSTLQTVSMMNTESPNKGKQMVLSTARLCCSKLVSIEWQGEECNIVQFEEDYEQTGFLSRSITPNLEEGTENLQKPLKGHNLNETSESKFFLPKASLISVTGCSSIDICNVMGSPNFDVKEPETIEAQGIQEENEAGEEYTYCEPGYALGLLNTPSFTVDCRSDDFTFGKGESKDEAQAGNKQQAESAVSSMNIDYDKQEVLSDVGYNFASSESKDRRIQTQREFAQGNHSTASDSGFPLSERDCTSKTSKNQAILRITNAIKSSNLSQDLRLQGLEELRSADRSLNKGNLDYQDSAEDSERFNLYKNIYVSDSEDADYDVPRSDILSESGASSQKGRIYNRIDDAIDLDSNQLFLDDELRAKYQTLLQNN